LQGGMARTFVLPSALTLVLGGSVAERRDSSPEGHYTGSYSGSDFGDLTLQVAANGYVTLDATSKILTTHYHGTGLINNDGRGTASTGTGYGRGLSFAFSGTFSSEPPVRASGTWSSSNGGSGNWNATRQE